MEAFTTLPEMTQDIREKYFDPDYQWKYISTTDLPNAREVLCTRDWLLEGQDDAYWFIMKQQKSQSQHHVRKVVKVHFWVEISLYAYCSVKKSKQRSVLQNHILQLQTIVFKPQN